MDMAQHTWVTDVVLIETELEESDFVLGVCGQRVVKLVQASGVHELQWFWLDQSLSQLKTLLLQGEPVPLGEYRSTFAWSTSGELRRYLAKEGFCMVQFEAL